MAFVNQKLELDDDYSGEIIRLARERSPNVDNWIAEERYLIETHEDNLNPVWMRNRCVIMIQEDLELMGIKLGMNPDDVCDNPDMVYIALMLRKKFNPDDLFELCKDHLIVVNDCLCDLNEDTLENVITFCNKILPLDEGWQLLADTLAANPGIFIQEGKFLDMISGVLERVDALGEPDVTASISEDTMHKYVAFLSKRVEYIRQVAYSLWANRAENEYGKDARKNLIDRYLDGGFEKQIASKNSVIKFAESFERLDLSDLEQVSKFLDNIRKPFLYLWEHTPDFYVTPTVKDIKITESMAVIMLATMVADVPNRLAIRSSVFTKLDEYVDRIGVENVMQLKQIFENMMTNMVEQLELNYAS